MEKQRYTHGKQGREVEEEATPRVTLARQPVRRRLGRWSSWIGLLSILTWTNLALVSANKAGHLYAFTRTRYNASIYENSPAKSYVLPDERMGIFTGSLATSPPELRYRLLSGDKDKFFKAEARQVGDFCFLFLRTRSGQTNVLNRERTSWYKLKVAASVRDANGDEQDLSGVEAEVLVTVLDMNDLNPLFEQSDYSAVVPEDTPLHQSLLKVKAEDADLGVNSEIYFSLSEPSEQFAVHPLTGVVSLTRPLDYANKAIHEFRVWATDRGPKFGSVLRATSAKVRFSVQPVNLHDPEILVHPLPQIVENSHTDVYAIVQVLDEDKGPNGEVAFLDITQGDPDGLFRVVRSSDNPHEFTIQVLKYLDRERAPQGYNLTLQAVDAGTPPRSSTQMITVSLTDMNDQAPVFEKEQYTVKIPEMAPVNTPLLRLKVTDADTGRNAQVSLSIVGGNEGGMFRVNPRTGVLYTAQKLDAETRAEYVLTVSAWDQGSTGMRKQSSAKVTIHVLDCNDNDPIFPATQMQISVDENEPPGLVVTQVMARDADKGENAYISYSLANLSPVPFEIDPFTGVVRTTQLLDYETGPRQYVLQIRASDWGTPYRRQTEVWLTVNVKDTNDNRPLFERVSCHGRVSRHTPIHAELVTLSALDFDAGSAIEFRIASGNEDACFGLDRQTGVLSLSCDLSDLGISERVVNVTATDGQHFADTMPVVLTLVGAPGVGSNRLRTTDSPGSGPEIKFECKSTGINKKYNEMIALAARNNYNPNLAASSSSTPFPPLPSRYGTNVHTPEWVVDFPAQVRVNESVASGTALVRLRARDRDHGYNGLLVYVISGGDPEDSVFQVDMESGLLRVLGSLDRERTASYTLNVTVFDLGQPQRAASKLLTVYVTDVNDNVPTFEKTVSSVSVAETAPIGFSVARFNATDADEGDHARVTYQLVTETPDFDLDPATGVLTVAARLDRERRGYYDLVILARDGPSPTSVTANSAATSRVVLSSRALVRVKILDVNDVPPRFAKSLQTVKIPEDVPEGTVVAVVSATDPDVGPGGDIRYSLAGVYASESVDRFAIDKLTGTVRVSRALDFEERQVYNLTVRARDRGNPALSSEAYLVVEVLDVNENLYAPRFPDLVTIASVAENAPIGTSVTKMVATDSDGPGDDSRIAYFIRGGDGLGLFAIDHEGVIRTRVVLDRESQSHYWVTVIAQDHGIVPLSASIEVFIAVEDENDNVPQTEKPIYWATVPENSPPKTPVLQIHAYDADMNPSQRLNFQFKAGNPQSLFDIDAQSGLITTTGRRLDRETQPEHILEVTVSDSGEPALSSSTRVVVQVIDVNDNAPEFLERFYKVQVPATNLETESALPMEDAEFAITQMSEPTESDFTNNNETWMTFDVLVHNLDQLRPVFRVVAFDRDDGANAELEYSLMEAQKLQGRFKIHPRTGVIYCTRSLAPGQEFPFNVRATDNGTPSKSGTARVSLSVLALPNIGVSSHAPVLSSESNRKAVLMETDPIGHSVAFIIAQDEDGDPIYYAIVGGNEGDKFGVNINTGKVYLAQMVDWEKQAVYRLNISITDGIFTIFTQLEVSVMDVNDHTPVFDRSLYNVNVSENVEVGTEILQLRATDEDQDKRVFYAIHGAASPVSLRKFKVDSTKGTITVAEKLDREMMSDHVLTVLVKDQGTPSNRNYARVHIIVQDNNDHAPEFLTDLIQVRVFETAAVGSLVANMMAWDRDRGSNARITYSIGSGNVGGMFTIDPDSGMVRLGQELDLTQASEYMLVINAADGGNPSLASTCRVHIAVVMAENDPPRFSTKEYGADVFEDVALGTFVIHVEGRSASSLAYEIVSGNDLDAFLINPSTGVIVTGSSLDYERTRAYNLTVRTTNMAGAGAQCTVLIHILDVNDNAPVFTQPLYEGSIPESAALGSLVFVPESNSPLVIQALDFDSGTNALLSYSIVEPAAQALFTIDTSTGAIRSMAILDHETNPVVEFRVQVWDNGHPRLTSPNLALVRIRITDVNDSPPAFTEAIYNATVLLPTYPGVAVLTLSASDPDTDAHSPLTYGLTPGKGAESQFAVNKNTGVLTMSLAEGLAPYYHLEVSVSDGLYTAVAYVNVYVEQVEASGLAFAKDFYVGAVTENSTRESTIVVLDVLGTVLNEHVTFRVLNPEGLFKVGLTSGVVQTTGAVFDRESRDKYTVIIEARSERGDGEKPRIAHTRLDVTVTDVNDNRPVFINLPYYAVVSLEAKRGDVVTKVHAVDRDVGENGDVRYELLKGPGELFRVGRKTGEISLKQTLEGHNTEYELLVAAYDGGVPPWSAEAVVRIKVIDRSMPVFEKAFYAATVSEKAPTYSPVLTVQASSPMDRKLIYSIVTGNDMEEFALDFNTAPDSNPGPCLISVVDSLDFESKSQYELTLRATDSVSGVYTQVPVMIDVEDANDCAPVFPQHEYYVNVSEATPPGTLLMTVQASDADSGLNSQIQYSLSSPTSSADDYFHVTAQEGSLMLSRSLDHETNTRHHLLVVATDAGNPSLSSTAHIWVTVTDINDNPPRFDYPTYACVLSEDAKRGQFVTMVTARDPDLVDETKLIYSIAGGNEQQMFYINPKTGIITLATLHRFGEQPSYSMNISVSDGVFTNYARLQVDLLSTNRHSPQFPKPVVEAEVMENRPSGTIVTRVTAQDLDRGEFGQLTYSISSDWALESFRIDESTGEILTRKSLDCENRSIYEIPVMAVDVGGKTGHVLVRIRILDENDNAPEFGLQEYKANIHSNHTPGTVVVKTQAWDSDLSAGGSLVYSMYESNGTRATDVFDINPVTGEIFLVQNASALANEVFQFFVRAEDLGVPPLRTEVPVDILIMGPLDKPPVFERPSSKYFLAENAPLGTIVTRVRAQCPDALTYSIVAPSTASASSKQVAVFGVDEQGNVFVNDLVDRETQDTYTITIQAATDASPALVATTQVVVQILDENDNAPEFESLVYQAVVAENADKKSSIIRVAAQDKDHGSHGEVRYTLGPEAGALADVFRLDPFTGWLTTLVTLDREEQDRYSIPVLALDNGSPVKLSSSATVVIQVKDYNDNPPQFSQSHYIAAVQEETLPGTVVVQLSTTDRDSLAASALEYYITEGDARGQFGIRSTGEIYVAKALDRETLATYNIQVLATDGAFLATTSVTIDVLDNNDNPPYCMQYRYEESVSEAALPGTFVLSVLATDTDEGPNAMLRYYLTGTGAEYFSLNNETGKLYTSRTLDREDTSHFELTAHVQDRDTSQEGECSSRVLLTITDVNDNPPLFTQGFYQVSVPEDAELRTLVTKIHAADVDLGLNRKVKYSLAAKSPSDELHFAIHPESGIVTVSHALDRETIPAYNLTVTAQDLGHPSLSATASLFITVTDVNDNPPEFSHKYYFAAISENAVLGSDVTRVYATSLDVGLNAEITYSILGGNEHRKFTIHPITGVISVAEALDFERQSDFFLTIQALDKGVPPISNHATLNISVLDANDNAPIFSQASYSTVVLENAILNEPILKVNAADLDSGENAQIVYAIIQGDRHGQFQIDPHAGLLSVASQLDREMIAHYSLEIEAKDLGNPPLSSTVNVNVEVLDVNDNPPTFSDRNYSTVAQEDKPLGFAILKFQVSDIDSTGNAGPYTFDLRAGNDGNAFRVDQDGTLRTATKFNHKIRDKYLLQVRVFDNGSPPLYSDTFVTVQIIEESRFPPVITPLEITINSFLDEFPGGLIGKLRVTDQDPYDTLTYSLSTPSWATKHPASGTLLAPFSAVTAAVQFEIDVDDGTLIAKPGLDVGSYNVNVSVSDGKFTSFATVKVAVSLVNQEAIQNGVIITLKELTAEDFVLSYKKSFLRAIRNILNVRTKDVLIISLQPTGQSRPARQAQDDKPWKNSNKDPNGEGVMAAAATSRPNLDVLFAVQKSLAGFHPPQMVRKHILDNLRELESTLGNRVVGIVPSTCLPNYCSSQGKCYDKVVLDDAVMITVTTDITSFVAPRHAYQPTCQCKDGFTGQHCDQLSTPCAQQPPPCPSPQVCQLEPNTKKGYVCTCPAGVFPCTSPSTNEKHPFTCPEGTSTGSGTGCYDPKHPWSFMGKSYAQYTLTAPIDKHLVVSLKLRSIQPTGNLMFAAGRVDYSVLEVVNGQVQYRFDCGSGEGLVRVTGVSVSDGRWHEIRVERHGNTAEVVVDGRDRAQGAAPGVNDVLNLESSDVYFGAEVRQLPGAPGYDDIRMGFMGCLDDIRLDHVALPHHLSSSSGPFMNHLLPAAPAPAILRRFTNVEFHCRVPLDRPGLCGSQPCLNGGTCHEMPGGTSYQCQCPPRFIGQRCEMDTDPCASSPCLYNGKCFNLQNDFRCECPPRLSGKRCEYGRFCNPNPCKNGGICEEGTSGPICKCRGFTGELCNVDVNECEPNPCHNGGTCINMVGSFQCLCGGNATGAYCTEPLVTANITSSQSGVTLLEIICMIVAILVIVLVVIGWVLYRRYRHKRKRHRRANNLAPDGTNGKEMVPLNSTRGADLAGFNRTSKMSNLEASQIPPAPMLPPRPASYTPSTEPTYIPLNNLDTIRSYGSAADDLETSPMLSHHNSPEYQPNLHRCNPHAVPSHQYHHREALSETDSLHKPAWADMGNNLKGAYYDTSKLDFKGTEPPACNLKVMLNDLKKNKETMGPSMKNTSSLEECGRAGVSVLDADVGVTLANTPPLSTPPPIPPLPKDYLEFQRFLDIIVLTQSQGARTSGSSTGYHWDCSDWAHNSQNPLPNITEIPGGEIPDSSSFHSNESNESNAQQNNDLPAGRKVNPERDLDTLVEDRRCSMAGMGGTDSEYGTDIDVCSQDDGFSGRNFADILARTGLRTGADFGALVDLDNELMVPGSELGESLPPPGNYARHLNDYLPHHSIASETEAEDPIRMADEDEEMEDDAPSLSISLPSQKSARVALRNPGVDEQISLSMGSYRSNASCSDVSNLCEIEDSEYEDDRRANKSKQGVIQTAV